MANIVSEGKEKGYVETLLHRRRYIPELKAKKLQCQILWRTYSIEYTYPRYCSRHN